MTNRIGEREGFAVIWVPRTPSCSGEVLRCLIDLQDVELANYITGSWMARWDETSKTFYVVTGKPHGETRTALLHRLITAAPKGLTVDHLNHDGLDNRRANLRVVTQSENSLNRRGARCGSTSGIRGIYWHASKRRWRVLVRLPDGTRNQLGSYHSIEEAAEARRQFLVRQGASV